MVDVGVATEPLRTDPGWESREVVERYVKALGAGTSKHYRAVIVFGRLRLRAGSCAGSGMSLVAEKPPGGQSTFSGRPSWRDPRDIEGRQGRDLRCLVRGQRWLTLSSQKRVEK